MRPIVDRTLAIADEKLDKAESDEIILRPRLGTGGNFQDVFFWDTAFTTMWARFFRDRLPVERSLDNLYRLQQDNGLINRQYMPTGEPKWPSEHPISVAPPVLTWAELELFSLTGDTARLARVYEPLCRHHRFISETLVNEDGLYFSDVLGCGMDNLPRWHRDWEDTGDGIRLTADQMDGRMAKYAEKRDFRWNRQGTWIDMSAQMALDSLSLARIAGAIGRNEDAEKWRREHAASGERINHTLWNEELGFYLDTGYGRQIPRLHIGGLWTLIAEVVPQKRLERICAHLENPETFGRHTPIPTLSASDPDFDPAGGYWLGASWAPTSYMVLKGLRANGREELAQRLATKLVAAVQSVYEETDTIWENYAPDAAERGVPCQPDFCGWSGLFTTAIPYEFLGMEMNAR